MTAQEKVQKLALYAVTKERLADPLATIDMGLNLHEIRKINRRLREELRSDGIDEATLNMSGQDLSMIIFETLQRHGL